MRIDASAANGPPWRARSRASSCHTTAASTSAGTKVGRRRARAAREHDAAAPHAVADMRTGAAANRDRAGDQPRREKVADIAEHQRGAAPHAIGKTVTGVAAHDQRAAAHAVHAAGQAARGVVTDVAGDRQRAARHFARHQQTGMPLHLHSPPLMHAPT